MKIIIITALVSLLLTFGNSFSQSESEKIGFDIYKQRRQLVCDSIGEGVAVLYAEGDYSDDGFRASGHFYYLTGLNEAGAILVLTPGFHNEQTLLLPPRNIERERWTGKKFQITDSLKKAWGFDEIARTNRLNRLVINCMKKIPVMHLLSSIRNPSRSLAPDHELYKKISGRVMGSSIESAQLLIEHMRMTKDKHEIAAIEKAIEITYNGITDLISKTTPGVTEFYLEAILNESFRKQGAQHVAFPAIVGAGENGAILHYESKDKKIEAGQLLLLDVGAQWNQYCADISRTIPIDGKFSERQAELYELVLKAQKAAIDKIKPGVMLRDVHEAAVSVFRDAGLLKYYFHGTSHHLGIDTHDVNDSNLPLAEGMVITVEPGLYIDDEKIGIRIEDDVLVTEKGSRVLSKDIPKTIKEVENWVQQAKK